MVEGLLRQYRQEALRHWTPNEWDVFVWGLREKGARLFGVRPVLDGPVKLEGFLCSAEIKGRGLKYKATPVVSHNSDMAARTLGGKEVRRTGNYFCFGGALYPSLTDAGLIDQMTLKSAEPAGSITGAFFLPTSVLKEHFSGKGSLEELERRQRQLRIFRRAIQR